MTAVTATRWAVFPAQTGHSTLSCRTERWTIDGTLDFLELSIVSDVAGAAHDQAALHSFLTDHKLTVTAEQGNKTQRVLNHLVAAAAPVVERAEPPAPPPE